MTTTMTGKKIALFGCGAVGSLLALSLSDPDIQFALHDDDKVDENNIATSAFYKHHIGAYKAQVLAEMLYRKSGCKAVSDIKTVVSHAVVDNVFVPDLILDCFDNVAARGLLCSLSAPTLHVGVSADRTGAVIWDADYILPDGAPRGQDQFCTHQAGKAIIRATAAVAARIVEDFLATGRQRSVVLTEDFTLFE